MVFRGERPKLAPTKSAPSKFCLREANALLSAGVKKLPGSVVE